MSNPIIERALELPSGAAFRRCALQVNPADYAGAYRGERTETDENEYNRSLIAKCVELGIEAIGVTHHNSVAAVDGLAAVAAEEGIVVFPGFEAASSEGVHVLCVYEPGTSAGQLERYLGQLGIHELGSTTDLADKALRDLVDCVQDKQDGLCIAAHTTNAKGLFSVLSKTARINAWQHPKLLAVQIPGAVEDAPDDIRPILRNKNADYRRTPSVGEDLALAVVNSADIAKPEDLEHPSATCWIKMSAISIEGLRQAFLDPDSRIRLSSDERLERHAELVAMSWEAGFLDGDAIHFNENLNVLVGGRGSGKSTVVESLRYALGLTPLGQEAQRIHEGIVRKVLQSGTKISLLVRTVRPSPREYLIERTIPNPPIIRDESGEIINVTPLDILGGIEVYGQHEISELTRSPEKLTRLLHRFIREDSGDAQRKAEMVRELERSRKRVIETQDELDQVREKLAALPALEETLKTYRDAGLEEKLKEKSLLVKEQRILATADERLETFREIREHLSSALPIDRAFLSDKALSDLPGRDILKEADEVLETFDHRMTELRDLLAKHLSEAEAGLKRVRAKWGERKDSVQEEYEKILRELQKSKVDGEEFIRLRERIEALRPLAERQSALENQRNQQMEQRRALLAEWEELRGEEYRILSKAAKRVNKTLKRRVRVEVTFCGDRSPLRDFLRDEIGGRISEAVDALTGREDLSLSALAEACRAGKEALAQQYGISPGQAERIAHAPPEAIMKLEELDLPPTTRIELNVAAESAEPNWQDLDALSTGQKATAVLLLLLLESEAPLIVDQPEDDLDNRFITEGIVPKMREEKRRRQFVFATHNANIPVLGDAELIVGLVPHGEPEGAGTATIPKQNLGSIDAPAVQTLVEEVLEGGREAFERRRLKYGF